MTTNRGIAIGPTDKEQRTYIGDVLMYQDQMVVFRDCELFSAKVEFEDGQTKWVSRNDLTLI